MPINCHDHAFTFSDQAILQAFLMFGYVRDDLQQVPHTHLCVDFVLATKPPPRHSEIDVN